ncbi:response regulator [Amaricoccus macauensis]|uniref:response regulator n=1 Tax=Amaricoccus macauensis TaxID=57001 RepID=UPI003C79D277
MPGQRVLVVEDEYLIAVNTEDMLTDLGYRVVGPALTLKDGLKAAERGGFDVALLDVNLTEGTSRPIAEMLRERGVPFAYVTGYGSSVSRRNFPPAPSFTKPINARGLASALRMLLVPQMSTEKPQGSE